MPKNFKLRLYGAQKIEVFGVLEPSSEFDGFIYFDPIKRSMSQHNCLIESLKRGYRHFDICEICANRFFWIKPDCVVEFKEESIVMHPRESAPYWARHVFQVYSCQIKGLDLLWDLES
jgi:hypothetical protein